MQSSRRQALFPALYPILDPAMVPAPLVPFARRLAGAGVRLMQLRDKRASAAKVCSEAKELVSQLSPLGVRVIVNDRPDIASLVGAGGVHVGQEDLPVEEVRKVCGAPSWVGVSTHNKEQLQSALRTSADYVAVGPIYPTATKENPDPVVGIEFLRDARRRTEKPLVAIGGITLDHAEELYAAGADSLAVISDLLRAPDPAARAADYLAIAGRVRIART